LKNSDTQIWEWKLLLKLKKSKVKILVTGCAGFIGSNLVDALLMQDYEVAGIDNFNDYYSPDVKESNLKNAKKNKNFKLYRADILDLERLKKIFNENQLDVVIHLAARAGVRPSLTDPHLYANVNVLGTVNLLKLSVEHKVAKFIFGSSSSVYGDSPKIPFTEDDLCQDIVSPYGASKRAAEFFVESFNKCFGLDAVVLRFFTVYGQRGRPDMAPALFTNAILKNEEIQIFGNGQASRDFTFIEDIIDGIVKALDAGNGFEVINLGGSKPVSVSDFIKTLEEVIGKSAKLKFGPKVNGDVQSTWANTKKAETLLKWKSKYTLKQGLSAYVDWYKSH